MLADSALSFTAQLGSSTPWSFVTNPTTAGTPQLMPYLLTDPVQNASGANNNFAVDLGAGRPLFLRGVWMNDSNGAGVNNLASITDVKVDIFMTSNSAVAAFTASDATKLLLGTLHLNDGVNYVKNFASGQDFYLPIPPIPAYMGTSNGTGPNYLGAMLTTVGAAFTTGAVVMELVQADAVSKNHSYKSGYSAY